MVVSKNRLHLLSSKSTNIQKGGPEGAAFCYTIVMKTEIETRFLEINKDILIEKLKKLGAIDKGGIKLNEIIFYDKELKSLENNTFIRLRQRGDKIFLTHKSNKEKGIDTTKEIEFEVSNFQAAKEFIETFDWITYRIVEKYRHTFELDGVTLDIDTWPKIPTYVELEGDSVDLLQEVAGKLGLNWEERFDADPRFVFKHYGFDFDKIRTVTFDKFE